jgi:hypothetical protein
MGIAGVLGSHPSQSTLFGPWLSCTDGLAASGVPHRSMIQLSQEPMSDLLRVVRLHHATPARLSEARKMRAFAKKYRKRADLPYLRLFPKTDSTRKGNFAEIILAEYVVECTGAALPIYRLRYNPNIDQSMKGDDVIAFDFGRVTRVIVGEAKFRSAPSATVVKEIAEALVRSYQAKLPVSLTFVANRLEDAGNRHLAKKVRKCAEDFVRGNLRIDYVGLLVGPQSCAQHVNTSVPSKPRSLVMISLGLNSPAALVDACFRRA